MRFELQAASSSSLPGRMFCAKSLLIQSAVDCRHATLNPMSGDVDIDGQQIVLESLALAMEDVVDCVMS